MTFKEFEKVMNKMFQEEQSIASTKGKEYTKGDRLDNFKRLSKDFGIEPKTVLMIYASKHWDSICNYVKEGKVHSEPIEGRIMDLRVYLALLRGLIEEEK